MTDIDTRPEQVDIFHYAGDTLTIRVNVSGGLSDGMVWRAQVKRDRESDVVDAEFQVNVVPGGADIILTAEDSRRLTELAGAAVMSQAGPSLRGPGINPLAAPVIQRYSGVWDVQISDDGADPVTSLVQGAITIDMDVSRDPA